MLKGMKPKTLKVHAGPEGCLAIGIFIKPNRFFESDGSERDMVGREYDQTWKGKPTAEKN